MSIEAVSVIMNTTVGDHVSKHILMGLANHAHADGTAAWPAKAKLAQYAECDPKTVQRHLRALEAAGWIRAGDQELVSHLRADRRPIVYDIALDPETRAQWAAEYATEYATDLDTADGSIPNNGGTLCPPVETQPVDNPRSRGDSLPPRDDLNGGTPETSRGDTAVSPKPSRTILNPPPPTDAPSAEPHVVAASPALNSETTWWPGKCPAHPDAPGSRCRTCGTNPRVLTAAEAKAAKRRAAEEVLEARQAQRRRDAALRRQAADPSTAKSYAEQVRAQLRARRDRQDPMDDSPQAATA